MRGRGGGGRGRGRRRRGGGGGGGGGGVVGAPTRGGGGGEAMAVGRRGRVGGAVAGRHAAPERFEAGKDLPVAISLQGGGVTGGTLYYRHVNQAEDWQKV